MEDHPRRSDGRRHCRLDRDTLDQLLGYLPLDYQDEYAVDTLALYSARYAHLVTWPVIELLTELAGGPVDLAELRIGFQEAARRSASTKSLSNRNMFGPVRGEWDRQWNGWWGDDPPFHAPVFVLTHYRRDPQPMNGGTRFHFVTDGIESALRQAREAAGDGDVSIQGGATTINQYLAAGLIDELRLHIVPLTLGAGTRLFDGVPPLKLEQVESRAARLVTHVTYRVLS